MPSNQTGWKDISKQNFQNLTNLSKQQQMEILEQTKTTEIQSIANDINKGIEAFEKRKSELLEMASHADGLKIESIDDREGIKEVSRLRKDLKFARVEIQKEGKAMRDPLTSISKFIIEK